MKSVIRLIAAAVGGLTVSIGLVVALCGFGGEKVCRDLIWPAATIMETGFEGQLAAAVATILAMAVCFGSIFWLLLAKYGRLKRL